MTGWYPVFRKEVANFFLSPIAYAVIGSFALISGYFFYASVQWMSMFSLKAASSPMFPQRINLTDFVVRPFVQNMSIVLLFLLPLLTMRLFAEEKKSGTIELLLTYPISDTGVTTGKYLASALVLLTMLGTTAPCLFILFKLGSPDPGTIIGGYLGLLLMGAAFLALGMFLSSLTENQIVASVLTFGAALLFWIMSWSSSLSDETTGAVIRQLCILEHLDAMGKGILALSDISFFVLFTAFFVFLTLRSLEAYRWRG